MRNLILVLGWASMGTGAQAQAPSTMDTPEALVELARGCVTWEDPISCLAPHVVERVYFPHARSLREASDVCAEAYRVAREIRRVQSARLVTSRFFWEMTKEDGRWVFHQLLLKP